MILMTRLKIDIVVKRISIRFTHMSSPSGNAFKLSKISLTRSLSVESVSVFTISIFRQFILFVVWTAGVTILIRKQHFFLFQTCNFAEFIWKSFSFTMHRHFSIIYSTSTNRFYCCKFEMQNNDMSALCVYVYARKCQQKVLKTTKRKQIMHYDNTT